MKKKDFIGVLCAENIMYSDISGVIVIDSVNGLVDLRSLTTLPEGVKFENRGLVNLRSLTTLPEGVKFENRGSVYLESLTTLPEGVKFDNRGLVDLRSLTTLPEGVKFENQGLVDLESLTTLPEGVKFENQGLVDLRGLHDKTIKYQDKELSIKHIDGSTMIINSSKQKDDFSIMKVQYFRGGNLEDLPKCFIAQRENFYAHGATIQQAINDVNFKFLQENSNISDLVKNIKEKQTVTTIEYRLLTGACSLGVENFLKEKNIDGDVLPLNEVIEITKGYYGGSKLSELFN